MREEMQRFLSRLSVADECWLWEGARNDKGYGKVADGRGGWIAAHRQAYALFVGEIPAGLHVLHTCDTPPCVNPRHLFLGTHADNMADMKIKGRQRPRQGEKHGSAKLSERDVRLVRTSPKSAGELAKDLGVTPNRIYQLRRGQGWNHLTEEAI